MVAVDIDHAELAAIGRGGDQGGDGGVGAVLESDGDVGDAGLTVVLGAIAVGVGPDLAGDLGVPLLIAEVSLAGAPGGKGDGDEVGRGKAVGVEGLDRLAERPGVNSVFLNRAPGDPVDWREGIFQYIYSVYGVASGYDEVLEINRFLHEEVSIVYE